MARINKTQYALLNFINRQPMSGYDVKHFAKKVAKLYWAENNAQIYPVLKQLEVRKLVQSELDPASGKRQRRIYKITDKGREYLREWIEAPTDFPPYREELLLKLANGYIVGPEIMIHQVEHYKAHVIAHYENYKKVQKHIAEEHVEDPKRLYLIMIANFLKKSLDAKLAWSEETLAELRTLSK